MSIFLITNRILRAALAVALSCAAAACVMQPPKTAAEREADKDLVDRVDASLKADPGLYARHINLRADNGVVTLSGYVWTTEELVKAKQDAELVSGVVKVVNRMEVDRGAITDSSVTR
jgi:osmotically-inducible protein OsmY